MKKLLICLKNIELVQKVFTELKNDEFFVEIYDKNQEYSSEKFDLVIVDSEFLKELETVINKLKNNTPIVAAFEKEIVTNESKSFKLLLSHVTQMLKDKKIKTAVITTIDAVTLYVTEAYWVPGQYTVSKK